MVELVSPSGVEERVVTSIGDINTNKDWGSLTAAEYSKQKGEMAIKLSIETENLALQYKKLNDYVAAKSLAINNMIMLQTKKQEAAENIKKEYESEPSSAPWVLAPIVYAMQADIFYDRYDGNAASIEQKAKEYSNQINPLNGT